MSKLLKPGTLCIVTYTPTGADMGRIVEVVRYLGPRRSGPEFQPEAYVVRCVAGRPFHSVRSWRPDGTFIVAKDTARVANADRSQLRPLPGDTCTDDEGVEEPTSLEVSA